MCLPIKNAKRQMCRISFNVMKEDKQVKEFVIFLSIFFSEALGSLNKCLYIRESSIQQDSQQRCLVHGF
jgi:hypothetical protein